MTGELSTSSNLTGQQLQLGTYLHEAFLSACCVQVVITAPGCVLSAFKTVSGCSSHTARLLEATAVLCSWKKLAIEKQTAVLVAHGCRSFLKYNVLHWERNTTVHPSVFLKDADCCKKTSSHQPKNLRTF